MAEGQPLTLDATGTVAPAGAVYAWDLDGDGQFDDVTGAAPTVSAAALAALGLGDGPAGPRTITVQVTATPTVRTATTTVTVTNVAPAPPWAPRRPGCVAGSSASVTFGASDPSAADTAAGFTYQIDWGDGTPHPVGDRRRQHRRGPHLRHGRHLHDQRHRHRQGRRHQRTGHRGHHRRPGRHRRRRRVRTPSPRARP